MPSYRSGSFPLSRTSSREASSEKPARWVFHTVSRTSGVGGTAKIVDHVTRNRGFDDPSLFQHSVFIESTKLTGVGEATGDTYTFFSHHSESVQSPDPVDPFPTVITVTVRDRIFGPEGGVLGLGMFSVSFVLNGAGKLVHEDVDFTGQCR
jgi:hypothetical protein